MLLWLIIRKKYLVVWSRHNPPHHMKCFTYPWDILYNPSGETDLGHSLEMGGLKNQLGMWLDKHFVSQVKAWSLHYHWSQFETSAALPIGSIITKLHPQLPTLSFQRSWLATRYSGRPRMMSFTKWICYISVARKIWKHVVHRKR